MKYYYFPQARPFNPFPNQKNEKINFFVFLKNDHFLDRLGENGQKSPKKAPKTPGMTLICVFTLKIIDFRPKIIGEEKLVPQIFKSALSEVQRTLQKG